MTPRQSSRPGRDIRIHEYRNLAEAFGAGPLGGGVGLTNGFAVDIADSALACDVSMIVVAHEGRLACGELTLRQRPGGPAITSSLLRAAVVDSYIAEVRRHPGPLVSEHVETFPDGSMAFEPAGPEALETFAATQKIRRSTSDLLPKVAAAYRDALNSPHASAPTAAVAKRLGYSRGHASRLLSQARDAGLLGPALRGQAGERVEQPKPSANRKQPKGRAK